MPAPRGKIKSPPKGKAAKGPKPAGGGVNKFKAKGTWEDDGFFSSKKELARYRQLQLLEKLGEIKNLKRQVPYKLVVNGVLISKYIPDAEYDDCFTGKHVVEDTKSVFTKNLRPYKMCKKLMKALFNIDILET